MVGGVIYLGNLSMKTMPQSAAESLYQYKVVGMGTTISDLEDIAASMEKIMNQEAQEGWEYIETVVPGGVDLVFRKKK